MKTKKTCWSKLILMLLIILTLIFGAIGANNGSQNYSDNELCVHVFIDKTCEECDEAKSYIDSLNLKDTHIIYHNINNESEKIIYDKFKTIYGLKSAGYPSVFIGEKYLIGINSIKKNFQDTIEECKGKECPCPANQISGITSSMPRGDFKSEKTETLNIPSIGEIDIEKMPLFVMTGLIAFIDGFNPCSLWVLTFLLGIVIYTGSRRKIFIVGSTFLLVTATAYGVFMIGLLNVFLYIGYLFWIKLLVGLIALIFAIVNIKDYFWYKKGISFTISDKHKPSMFKKIRNIMNPSKSLLSMIFATIIMALGIVLVELPCTAGFPMIWSNIMAQNKVTGSQFTYLFLLYLLIYLSIELIIFISAVMSLKATKFEEKHGRVLKLVGGIIMLALGITIIFFPNAMNSIKGSIYLFGIAGLASFLIIFIHRKILPIYGINIGTEELEHKNLNQDNQTKYNKNKKSIKNNKSKKEEKNE
ncbi:MAG: thioredoxin [Nanoarchaeota archaeon]